MLAKVEQKANASPQHLLSNIGELATLFNAYNTWMTLRSNLDVVHPRPRECVVDGFRCERGLTDRQHQRPAQFQVV